MRRVHVFSLPDITCFNCIAPIEKKLRAASELKKQYPNIIVKPYTDILEKRIYIEVSGADLPDKKVKEILKKEIEDLGQTVKTPSRRFHLLKGIVGIVVGAAVMAFCLLGGMALPAFALYTIFGFCTALTLFLGYETYRDALKIFQLKTLTMDSLFTISTLTALGASITSLFIPGLHMMFFDAALFIFGFRHIGKAIEESIKKKILSSLSFRDRAPKKVLKIVNGKESEVDIETLAVDDTIKIQPGQIIPVDGECLDRAASIYDTIKTGNTLPKRIKATTPLLAGMKVAEDANALTMTVLAKEEDSYLVKLDKDIQQARMDDKKAPLEMSVNRYLSYFIIALLAVATITSVAIFYFCSLPLAITVAALMLSMACPCTAGLITPLTLKIGMTKGEHHGVHFKNGESLQQAGDVDTVFFDLNGTLTTGEFVVTHFSAEKISKEKAYAIVNALEENEQHPIALSLKKFIHKRKPSLPFSAKHIDRSHHSGIRATIKGVVYTIGNKKMMDDHHIKIGEFAKRAKKNNTAQIIYLAKGDEVVGQFTLHCPLRKDAASTLTKLKRLGKEIGRKIQICLLTGADQETASYYAKQLRITPANVKANCSDADKSTHIEAAKKAGKHPVMVGDSGNDSVPMSKCFGIAIKSSASDSMTEKSAGVVIEDASLSPVLTTLSIATQTFANIKKNFTISFIYNALALLAIIGVVVAIQLISNPIALSVLMFALNPAVGVIFMIAQMVINLLITYHFSQQKLPAFIQENTLGKENSYSAVRRELTVEEKPPAPTPLQAIELQEVRASEKTPWGLTLLAPLGAQDKEELDVETPKVSFTDEASLYC